MAEAAPAGAQGAKGRTEETLADTMFGEYFPVSSSNPREGEYIELAIHGPLWVVQGHMGHSHICTLTVLK
jgi:hypothetical protein